MQSKAAKLMSRLLMTALIVFLAMDAILLLSSPFWLHLLYSTGPVDVTRGGETYIRVNVSVETYAFMQAFVALSGIVLGALLFESIRALRNAHRGNPFTLGTAKAFRHCGWLSLAQMALFLAKMFSKPSLLTLGCAGVFLIATLLYFVLADLFHSAALLREDNDLTI